MCHNEYMDRVGPLRLATQHDTAQTHHNHTETERTMAFSETCAEYIDKLRAAGFTVYEPANDNQRNNMCTWFHYSREVDGQTCYGTYFDGTYGFEGDHHTMPLRPSRLNGSSAHIGGKWGDEATLGLDAMEAATVEYAEAVARPTNWCPFNYPETLENTQRANIGRGVPKSAARGATLRNAKPWGIDTHYVPVS